MDLEQDDFHRSYLLQEDIHKEEDINQEESMQEGLKKSKPKKDNVEDIAHEDENFDQEQNIQQDEENISDQNGITQEEEHINQEIAENTDLEQETIRQMEHTDKEEEAIKQEDELKNNEKEIVKQEKEVNNPEEEIINQEEEVNDKDEEIINQEEKVNDNDDEIINQEEELNNNEKEFFNQEKEIDSKEKEIINEEEEAHAKEEKISNQDNTVNNEEGIINQEVNNKKEEIINQENIDRENTEQEQEIVRQMEHSNKEEEAIKQEDELQNSEEEIVNQEKEVNNIEEEIVNKEEEVNDKDEEIINEEEELNNKEKDIFNQEKEVNNKEKEILKREDELQNSEEIMNQEKEVNNPEEEILHQKEEVDNNDKEIINQEDEVNDNDMENINEEEELNNREKEIFNQEKEVNNKEKEILKQEDELQNSVEEIMNQEKEVNNPEEEILHQKEEVDNNDKEIINQEEKVNNKEKEIFNQEKEVNNKEKEILKREDELQNSEEIMNQEKEVNNPEEITNQKEEVDDNDKENINQKEDVDNNGKENINEEEELNNKEKEIFNQENEVNNKEKEIINQEDEVKNKEEKYCNEGNRVDNEEEIINQEKIVNNKKEEIINQEKEVNNKEEVNIYQEEELNNKEEEIINKEEKNVNLEEKLITHEEKEIPEQNISIQDESISQETENITKNDEEVDFNEGNANQESEDLNQENISEEEKIIHKQEIVDLEEEIISNGEKEISREEENINDKETIIYDKEKDIDKNNAEPPNLNQENIIQEQEKINHEVEKEISQQNINQEEENIIQEEKNISQELANHMEDSINEKNTSQDDNTIQVEENISQEEDIIIHQPDNTNQKKENVLQEENFKDEVDNINKEDKNFNKDNTNQEDESTSMQKENSNEDTNPEEITPQEKEDDTQDEKNINEEERINQEKNSSPETENVNEEENSRQETENISKELLDPEEEDIVKDKVEQISESKVDKPEDELTDNMQDATIPQLESTSEDLINHRQKTMFNILQSLDLEDYFWGPKMKKFNDKLRELNLVEFITSKLSLMEVLKIGQEDLKKNIPQRPEDVPWHFLQNLMSLNSTARNTRLDQSLDRKTNTMPDEDMDFMDDLDMSTSINPLDVLCLLLNCSDSFLQQEIVTKMSMCQFALPLLLPAGEGLDITYMLWAMRDIVKRWRPQSLANVKGCMENNLANIPMPVFSFARLGRCSLSKSRILNYILSPVQQHYDFFVHQNMEGANIVREVSDGLVEISWCFPGGNEILDLFPDPIAVTNLRGDLESNWGQFNFLTKVSSAVFIFIESMDDQNYSVLSNIEESNTNYFIVLAPSSRCISLETQNHIRMLYPILKINRKNVLVKNNSINDAELVKKMQLIITDLIKSSPYYITLEEMSHIAADLGIRVDEGSEEHQKTRTLALEITKSVKDVVQYKNETMRLQGEYWKQLAKIEKEMCRMKGLGSENAEDYRAKLVKKCCALRRQQSECSMPDGIFTFIAALQNLPRIEKHYFLKWMKLYLDSVTRNHLSALQIEYKEQYYKVNPNVERLKQLDQIILNSSLGVEHFIREVGQFYEAEHFLAKDCTSDQKLYKLPGIAADLLLDGFPLELIDGDASNIPMQWITDVLTELDTKTGGECKMKVITVLGVQSTGKSTLLNTMFGLQFPVASGRCTRGAFMTLLRVKNNLIDELGCDFILVIDTEGLKAPELASVEDSYEHDNELATFVVGLSDITIINMAMENTAEIKDILQIVVHAFLRMKELGKKPNCQFVHQNVSDVSAYDKNMRDRKKLLEQLDEMTKVASRMEEKSNMTKFSDVMDYDLERHSWYIPGLWHGVPPMASVNTGYSENIFELKKQIFETMKKQLESRTPQSISDFIKWIKSLWNAVKYEKFIFSFRNSLVAEAYNQLSIKYSELEWNFRKRMHKWIIEAENEILNQPSSELESEIWGGIKEDMYQVLQEEERVMLEALEQYFESGNKYVHLVERYKEDFFRSATILRNEVEDNFTVKCEEDIRIQKGKHEIQFVQNSYLRTIEEKATSLLDNCKNVKHQLSDEELKSEFEVMWNKTLSGLQFSSLKKHNVSQEMIDQLRKDMRHKAGYLNEKLNEVKSLDDYGQNGLDLDKKYTQGSWYENMPEVNNAEYWDKVNSLVTSLKEQCNHHVTEQVNTMKDYDQTYCQELLNFVNERLNEKDVRSLHLTPLFELDLKLLLLGQTAPIFQKKHNIFFQENNMKSYLDKIKPQYFSTFKNVYQEKDESKIRAQKFCEVCLKPALSDYVYKNLGGEIVNDILTSGDSIRYSSRTFFQYTLLKELLENHNSTLYIKYNNHYETFVKSWIVKFITNRYKESTSLESLKSIILACISRKVRQTLKDPRVRETSSVSQCLKTFCLLLKKDLVILQNEMKVIAFQNNASPVQFSSDILEFLEDVEKEIITEINHFTIEYVLNKATLKPQDELFKKVFGCGKQCPFCKAPCEAGAANHKEHFASVHRPQGLGTYRCTESKELSYSICTTDVVGNTTFLNSDTEWKPHLYKEYRKIYPDWTIQPDVTIGASSYWKYIFKEFNKQFSDYYNAKPATLPGDWHQITKEQALQNLKESFNMN